NDGASWIGPTQTQSHDVGGVVGATVGPDGTPYFVQDGTGFVNVFKGLDGQTVRNVFPRCCGYAASIAVDSADVVRVAFYSNATATARSSWISSEATFRLPARRTSPRPRRATTAYHSSPIRPASPTSAGRPAIRLQRRSMSSGSRAQRGRRAAWASTASSRAAIPTWIFPSIRPAGSGRPGQGSDASTSPAPGLTRRIPARS